MFILLFSVGSCLQGYFCTGGATQPTPHSSDNSPGNGPCPVGHYCPAGCLAPIPCPLGSIRKTIGKTTFIIFKSLLWMMCFFDDWMIWYPQRLFNRGGLAFEIGPTVVFFRPAGGVSMESCSACPAGHYCSAEGLASPSGPCAAGFYCPFDYSSTTPYAFLCPKVKVNFFHFSPSFTELSPLFLRLLHCSYCFPNGVSPGEFCAMCIIMNLLMH